MEDVVLRTARRIDVPLDVAIVRMHDEASRAADSRDDGI